MNRYGHYMTVLDSSFCTVETITWLWKFLSSSLPQCLCQEHEETCSQTKSRRRNRNYFLVYDKMLCKCWVVYIHLITSSTFELSSSKLNKFTSSKELFYVKNCENGNACSENFVKSCSAFVISTAFESNHTADTSTELLTTQTDQSKCDILIDYVPNTFLIVRKQ